MHDEIKNKVEGYNKAYVGKPEPAKGILTKDYPSLTKDDAGGDNAGRRADSKYGTG